jgi:Zn-dependent protease with chaperone function
MALEMARRFPQISPKAYEHPADKAATAAIRTIPLMEPLLKRLSELGLDRRTRQILLGNAVRLGPDQVPTVWEQHVAAASTLDVDTPPLYVTQAPFVNALTTGARRPVVVVYSSLITTHDPDDVRAVLSHEMGHVLSEHYYYNGVLFMLAQLLASAVPVPLLAGLPVRALYLALLEWSRAAELSSDRAAAISLGDPLAVCGTLMRVAGGNLPGADLQAFLRQAAEYVEEDDLFARRARFGAELVQTHPYAVRRVRELVDWVGGGDYDRIMAGSYVRRGEEPSVSAEFDAAVRHYSERFGLMLARTGGGLAKLTGQIQGWLRRNTDDGDVDELEGGGD